MVKVIERVEAHYEVQDLEMGKVYRWCPGTAMVECACREELTLRAFNTTCPECGADHADIVEEVLEARAEDEGDHPWRYLQPYTPTRGA
jgi:Zn finger protein HypA/HybF involved in hydrogenase expression